MTVFCCVSLSPTQEARVRAVAAPDEVVFDTDPKLAVKTRERIMRELDGDTLVGGPHFPGLRFGRVLLAEGKRYWS